MWFLLDDFCLIDLFLWVLVEFFEMNCFIFVSDLDVGVALDFGFNIGDMVCLTFTNLLVVAEVAAFVLAVVIIVFIVGNTVLFTAAAVVVGVGIIVEVLNWLSGSTLWIIVSHMSTSKQVYLFKYTSIVWVCKNSLTLELERSVLRFL